MVHLTARSRALRTLFRTAAEGRHLLRLATAYFPTARALVLMPDHLHVVAPAADAAERLARLMRSFARWRNAHRQEDGAVWEAAAPPETPADATHLRRLVRYVFLNPCRKGLVTDPLAWPWSTYREVIGLDTGFQAAVSTRPEALHRYVAADATVAAAGALPDGPHAAPPTHPLDLALRAVSALTRTPLSEIEREPAKRALVVRATTVAGVRDERALAAALGLCRTTVYRNLEGLPAPLDLASEPRLLAVVRAMGDARFPAVEPAALDFGATYRLRLPRG